MSGNKDPRNYKGYGANPPHPKWPNKARIAVQFVLNYEEGGENCVLNGDPASEVFLSEIIGASPFPMRHMSMESIYEYGSRAGVWRILRLFKEHNIKLTVFAVAMALEKYPEIAAAFLEDDHEIACHGYRWISYQAIDEATERLHMQKAIDVFKKIVGSPPLGWYTGRTSPFTRRLVAEYGHFRYDADDYSDDLPYWHYEKGQKPQLIVPYTLDANDMRFATAQGFNSGEQFYTYLRDSFDCLYAEGARAPKMMSIGLHCRLIGRPGRIMGLKKFLDYISNFNDIWIARRIDIAEHWHQHHSVEIKEAERY